MEISLAEEHAYYFVPQISLEVARDRIEKKKTSLVAGKARYARRRRSRQLRVNFPATE